MRIVLALLIVFGPNSFCQTVNLSYDHSGRMNKASYSNQKVLAYIYDNDGNRSSQQNYIVSSIQITVGIQGDMLPSGDMRAYLQNYYGFNLGLLPTTDPYGLNQSYSQINNPTGPAGTVVDWVKVTIRSASSPSTIYQSRALLLKPFGNVVDTNGNTPIFNPQNTSIRISIVHRNHLAILSNPITSFSTNGFASYDFTTSLSQASNDFSDPPQMVKVGSKWCMWVGDVNSTQDLFIDNVDELRGLNAFLTSPFDMYLNDDLTMDGYIDNTDYFLQHHNFLLGLYSTLINY